jgi:hypothetical protein
MTIRRKVVAIAALSLLLVPNVALADDNQDDKDRCNVPAAQQDEECKKRQGGFQTRFFSE